MQAIFSNAGSLNHFRCFSTRRALTPLPRFDMPEGEWYEKDRQKRPAS